MKRGSSRGGGGRRPSWRALRRWSLRILGGLVALLVLLLMIFRFVNPPITPYMLSERLRLGSIDHQWAPLDRIAPAMARSVVAAEDANFCDHWGFDIAAIRAAAASGYTRGASTIDQQVVRNLLLWQGHSWPRKALEALITPVMELLWPKRRILEVYLNIAEFDEGDFGVAAGAAQYFHVEPDKLSATQAALMASVLPDPKGRNAAKPTRYLRHRADRIASGARTIEADGRAKCFEH